MAVRRLLAFLLSCWMSMTPGQATGAQVQPPLPLEEGFLHPPPSARPWVYWFWMDGNVTQAGIAADLQAMQRVGIGGALLMDVTQGLPPGPVHFGTPEWMALFKYAVAEAGRLGLELSVNNAGGWSGSGGPWISPALAMQKLVSTHTNLTGPLHFSGPLPQFFRSQSDARTVATLAFPALPGEGGPVPGFPPDKVSCNGAPLRDQTKLFDGDPRTFVSLAAPTRGRPEYLQLEFVRPFTASSFRLVGTSRPQRFQGTLQASVDGRAFHNLHNFNNTGTLLALPFEQTSARYYRFMFTQADPALNHLEFSELELSPGYRIPWYQSKSGAGPMPSAAHSFQALQVPANAVIAPQDVLDLSSQIDAHGLLTWDVPKGTWTVLRLGCAPLATENHTASPGGLGLECDKLSRTAIEHHFASFLQPLIQACGSDSALKATHIDSWEIGFQNWTPQFIDEFRARRGYDPLHYLPALTGRFVGGPEQSERFLWDVRRTIADLTADNYAGHLAELAHRYGLQLSVEAYASLGKGPFDDLLYAGRADVPMTEFWFGTNDLSKLDLRSMPSAAHTYGKPIVAAEAFTSEPMYSSWQEHPYALKPLADAAFCEGVNRLIFHRFAHQPWTNRAPGMTMGPFGVHYERTQTWWEQSRPWHEYLTRCQFLLQSGRFVADLCYLTPEGAFTQPPGREQLQPALPPGYNYDLASPEAVLTRLSVKDGKLLLPDGMSYQVLVLPKTDVATPSLLRKIKQLVTAGAIVIGPRPTRSPSLAGYPACDPQVKELAGELWGACDGQHVMENRLGQGRIIWGEPLAQVLEAANVKPDFVGHNLSSGEPLHFIHRRIGKIEVYFVANPNPRPVRAECQFRVAGLRPEFWHPENGSTELPAEWHQQDDRTTVRLHLDEGGSVFVVFRASSAGVEPVETMTRNGQADESASLTADAQGTLHLLAKQSGTYQLRLTSGQEFTAQVNSLPPAMPISGPWELSFPPRSGAPERITLDRLISWTAHSNPGVKYFSGAATYKTSFVVSPDFIRADRRVYLDLGKVEVIAVLKVNAVNLGILWKPPFEMEVTKAIKPGGNELEIKVVNLWPNRIIGDEQLPQDCKWQPAFQPDYGSALAEWPAWLQQDRPSPTGRFTFKTWRYWHKDSPLLESGLLGPVMLQAADERQLP